MILDSGADDPKKKWETSIKEELRDYYGTRGIVSNESLRTFLKKRENVKKAVLAHFELMLNKLLH